MEKITTIFCKIIIFFIICNKKTLVSNYIKAIGDTLLENLHSKNIFQKAALVLRKSILQTEKKKYRLKILPQQVLDVYFTLLGGCYQKP